MSTKKTDPPLRVAWQQALAGIRVRFGRQLVTLAGIGLGIAFFAAVQTMRILDGSKSQFDRQRLQWLAATSLLMCLIGVTNAMLMSVTERYREIGTFKCLGASNGFVVRVFLIEALLLGSIGSVCGSLLGCMAVCLMQGHFDRYVLNIILLSSSIGLVMTVLASIFPAIAAAKMPAAAALRVEV